MMCLYVGISDMRASVRRNFKIGVANGDTSDCA